MKRVTKKLKLLVAGILLVILALVTYGVLAPEYNAAQYIKRLRHEAQVLQPSYLRLAKSTEQDLISDPNDQARTMPQDVERLRSLLQENRINLKKFSLVVQDYTQLPYTGFTPQAKDAMILQYKAISFADQSNDAFTKYTELIDFIRRYDATENTIMQHVNEFNATSDLNTYAGQYDRIGAVAEQIRTDVQLLDTTPTPHEAVTFKTASIQSFRQLADGFDVVATGLRIPADDVIYSGARQIDEVDRVLNGDDRAIYIRDILSSRTIKSIQELPEKLDLIIP